MVSLNKNLVLAPAVLGSLELFAGLTPSELAAVRSAARLRRLDPDYRIFAQGQPADAAHALISGSVRISQSGSDGGQVVLRFIGSGEMFGTIALFTDGHYPAAAVTLAESLEATWSEAEVRRLMSRHPQIAVNVIRIVGKRLREVEARVRELSTQRVEQRVAHAVLRLARQAGQSTAHGTAIQFPLRRRDVAEFSGTTLHTASRILAAWEEAGLLVSRGRRLILLDPAAISDLAEGSA